MSPVFITIVVVLAAVFAIAARMDFKRRHLDDTRSAGAMTKDSRQVRLSAKEKGTRWGAGH